MEQNKNLPHTLTIDEWMDVQNKVTVIAKERGYSVTESIWFAHGYTHATGEWQPKYDELKAENAALKETAGRMAAVLIDIIDIHSDPAGKAMVTLQKAIYRATSALQEWQNKEGVNGI